MIKGAFNGCPTRGQIARKHECRDLTVTIAKWAIAARPAFHQDMHAIARFARIEEFSPSVAALHLKFEVDQIFRRQPRE
jgi:hypothetical protein